MRLLLLVAAGVEHRLLLGPSRRPEILRVALPRELHDGVGGIQNRLGRAVILFERDRGRSGKLIGKIENVANRGGSKRVDRLSVVADHHDVVPLAAQGAQDVALNGVGVLIFVDQDVVEHLGELFADAVRLGQSLPVVQQIIVIEHLPCELALRVGLEDRSDAVDVLSTPGKLHVQHVAQLLLCVDGARVNPDQRLLTRKAAVRLRHAELAANQVHHVGRVADVHDGEVRRQAEGFSESSKQAVRDRVKRAAPGLLDPGGAGQVCRSPQHLR